MPDNESINKLELQGMIEETPNIHSGSYGDIGNFILVFPCVKKGEFGRIRGSTFSQTACDKLKGAVKGDGILVKGKFNEEHWSDKGGGGSRQTKKIHVEELWIMKTTKPAATQPVATQPEDKTPPPHTASDMPTDMTPGGQWE